MLICVQMAVCDGAWEKEREKEVGKEKCKRWVTQQVGASALAERELQQHRKVGTKWPWEQPVVSATSLGRSCCQPCAASVSGGKLLPPGKPQTLQHHRLHKQRTGKETAGRSRGARKGGKETVVGSVKGSGINLLWGFLQLL